MNDRIRELQAQAFLECKAFEDGAVIKTDDAFEKFAELIVKECIGIVRKNHASVHGVQALMKHFGVE